MGAVLRTCVARPGQPLPPELAAALARGDDAARLAQASSYHRVTGFVRQSVTATPGVHPAVHEALDRAHGGTIDRHLRAVADVRAIRDALEGAGVPWLLMKGPVLAETLYPAVDLRPYNDLDVLVPGARLEEAIEALRAAGGELVDRNWDLFLARETGEVHLVLPYGVLCDLHWHVLHDREERATFAMHTDDLLGRAGPQEVGGTLLPTMDPVDTLHHLLVHACLAGAERLIWLVDVDLMVRRVQPDWTELVDRSLTAGTGLLCAVVLSRAQRTTGAPVPDGVVGELDPHGIWTHLVAAADHLRPPERVTGRGSLPRLVARATHRDLRSSLTRAGRHAASWLATAGHPRRSRRQPSMSPDDPVSVTFEAGGEQAYRAFLRVAARAHRSDARPA